MGVLFPGICFLSGFSERGMAVCCLFCWPARLMCLQGAPAGVEGWDTAISGGGRSEGDGLWSLRRLRLLFSSALGVCLRDPVCWRNREACENFMGVLF